MVAIYARIFVGDIVTLVHMHVAYDCTINNMTSKTSRNSIRIQNSQKTRINLLLR